MTHSSSLIVESSNSETLQEEERLGIVSVRIMVHEWPMASRSNLRLIVVQEEVTEIDEKRVSHTTLNYCICWPVFKFIGALSSTVNG